ncbi:MAG: hypothetical protein R3327_07500, partial [Nitrosopumilaceae archaeon]|nr:hypothetical protein [Nitrosopumilaceae archaeon]
MLIRITVFVFVLVMLGTVPLFSYSQNTSEVFPDWVKTTMKFWSEGKITDVELKNAIEYLLEKKIIVVNDKTTDIPVVSEGSKIISGVSLSGIDLSNVDFSGATINNVD